MSLRDLARHHGIATGYGDRAVPDATLRLILEGLGQDPDGLPQGAAAPTHMEVPEDAKCYLPEGRGWGLFCQLYELRSTRNWGIGDFADLAALARISGAAGADFLGINPVHALFTSGPSHASPFSPSNRRFLNPLYIAPDLVGCVRPDAFPDGDLVDYPAVAAAKFAALRTAFDAAAPDPGFDTFVAEGGEALRLHALFEVISNLHGGGWPGWPADLQDPASIAVRTIAENHAQGLRFHLWLQWVARMQLRAAQKAATDAGMRIGLYLDLAVGEAQDGSATWSGAAAALPQLNVGAPPDVFSEEGQNWQLAAPSPAAMQETDFASYRAMIGAQLRDAGALRVDHAMALWQLFLIPDHEPASAGAHLRYPLPEMIHALAAESRAARAVVIGEDLGFVPAGFRDAMAKANVLSYRIAYFEQDESGFLGADTYPDLALACLSTHDLPVLAAWWKGIDIDLRHANGLVSDAATEQHRRHRAKERRDMIAAYGAEADAQAATLPDTMLDAAHAFIAATPCLLAGVRLADLVGPEMPTNMPGTTDGHPNWRPRSATAVENIADHPTFARVTALMRAARPRP